MCKYYLLSLYLGRIGKRKTKSKQPTEKIILEFAGIDLRVDFRKLQLQGQGGWKK